MTSCRRNRNPAGNGPEHRCDFCGDLIDDDSGGPFTDEEVDEAGLNSSYLLCGRDACSQQRQAIDDVVARVAEYALRRALNERLQRRRM